jgi:hypothetical protein
LVWWLCQIRRGQGQQALQDPRGHALDGRPAVVLQVKLALERLVDRLDPLPQRPQQPLVGPGRLALERRAQQLHASLAQDRLGLSVAVALVDQDDHPVRPASGPGSTSNRSTRSPPDQ